PRGARSQPAGIRAAPVERGDRSAAVLGLGQWVEGWRDRIVRHVGLPGTVAAVEGADRDPGMAVDDGYGRRDAGRAEQGGAYDDVAAPLEIAAPPRGVLAHGTNVPRVSDTMPEAGQAS